MTQITTGVRSVLGRAGVYAAFQNLLGARALRRVLVQRHLRPGEADRMLDIGCGTGDILEALPAIEYVGVDLSEEYVRAARRRFGERGRFQVADARALGGAVGGDFTLVTAVGLLHHLDDEEAATLLGSASKALRRGGRLVTVDACFTDGQSPVARYLISRDRGRNVRTPPEYRRLAARWFSSVEAHVRGDLLRIPYDHCILECTA